jgi:hypothetical protein
VAGANAGGTAAGAADEPVSVTAPSQPLDDDEVFVPSARNYLGHWRTDRPLPKDIEEQLNDAITLKVSLAWENAYRGQKSPLLKRLKPFAERFPRLITARHAPTALAAWPCWAACRRVNARPDFGPAVISGGDARDVLCLTHRLAEIPAATVPFQRERSQVNGAKSCVPEFLTPPTCHPHRPARQDDPSVVEASYVAANGLTTVSCPSNVRPVSRSSV